MYISNIYAPLMYHTHTVLLARILHVKSNLCYVLKLYKFITYNMVKKLSISTRLLDSHVLQVSAHKYYFQDISLWIITY